MPEKEIQLRIGLAAFQKHYHVCNPVELLVEVELRVNRLRNCLQTCVLFNETVNSKLVAFKRQ